MTDWIGCLNNKWVRASTVQGVYVAEQQVKLRAPGVWAWDPIYMECDSTATAHAVAASLVADLAGAPR